MLQKRKTGDDAEKDTKDKAKVGDDDKAKAAAMKAKEVLDKTAKAAQKPERKGRWEECCGIKVFIPE